MLNTAQKIAIARGASMLVRAVRSVVGRGPEVEARRGGILWSLDLREGIDLSVYLLGAFEPATVRCYSRIVKPGHVVLDIGANVGAHTLPLAHLVGDTGRVVAFEPTRFAYGKLLANIRLNPALGRRILALQIMLVDDAREAAAEIYASWPLVDEGAVHAEHRGRLMDTIGASAAPLDRVIEAQALSRVDFIKLDVDGHEHEVLVGARETLARHCPTILMELAPYVFADWPGKFDAMLHALWDSGYELRGVDGGALLPREPQAVRDRIPRRGGLNVLASPR